MDALTPNQLARITMDYGRLAGETVRVEEITSAIYVFGSELACSRLHRKLAGRVGYSENRGTWYFQYERGRGFEGTPQERAVALPGDDPEQVMRRDWRYAVGMLERAGRQLRDLTGEAQHWLEPVMGMARQYGSRTLSEIYEPSLTASTVAHVYAPQDPSVGLSAVTFAVDLGSFAFDGDAERERVRDVLADAFRQIADGGVHVHFDDELPADPDIDAPQRATRSVGMTP